MSVIKTNNTFPAVNHRPKPSPGSTTTITPSHDKDIYNLSLKDAEIGEYKYAGAQHPSSSMALFYDPSEKAFVLDKLEAEFRFNLRSTPVHQDASDMYPQLGSSEASKQVNGDGLFGDGSENEENADDETPDPNNPYDYRHFLNKGHHTPSPLPSHASTPIPNHTFNSSPALLPTSPHRPKPTASASRPTSRPSRPKERPPQAKPRYLSPQLPPRRHQDSSKARSKPKPKPKPKPDSKHSDSDSDSNALVIDMGDSATTSTTASKPWRSALRVLNENTNNSTGPISLRSAASSMSPSIRGGSPSSESDKDQPTKKSQQQSNKRQSRSDEEIESDANADVDEIDLNPASQVDGSAEQPRQEAATPGNGWGDEEDDELEAELALALEEDQAKSDAEAAEAASRAPSRGESSEESEEE